ncbi:MFS transporter [Streptomyces sp. NPDC059909]|uniref:MFS transporter n=1 Tax=Streptomyces sp. NPDC059909 TaxID=3346998 RepID=UPI00364CBBC5
MDSLTAQRRVRSRKRFLLAAMGCAGGMVLFDQTVVAVALTPMARDLGLDAAAMYRVVLIYVLSLSSLAAVVGMIARRFGFLRTVQCGVVLFAAASACCGLTPPGETAEPFILVARAVKGAGAALMLSVATAVITDVHVAHERGKALAVYAAYAQIFLVMGPVAGALLTHVFGWRSVFLVNVPVSAAILWMLTQARLPKRAQGGDVAVLQAVLVVLALVVFVFGLFQSGAWGLQDARTITFVSAGLLLLALSAWVVLRSRRPILDLRLMKLRAFAVAVALTFLVQAGQLSLLVHAALHLQQVQHLSVVTSGAMLLALVVPLAAGTYLSGRLRDHFGSARAATVLGLACGTAGVAAWTSALASDNAYGQIPGMLAAGLGMGMPIPALSAEMMNSVPDEARTDASVLRQTLRQMGGAFGLAVIGAVALTSNDRTANGAGVFTGSATVAGFIGAGVFLTLAFVLALTMLPRHTERFAA